MTDSSRPLTALCPRGDRAARHIRHAVLGLCLLLIGAPGADAAPGDEKVFQDWRVSCQSPEGSDNENCFIVQNLVLKKDKRQLLSVVVGYPSGRSRAAMLITLPLGFSLPPGLTLRVDDGDEIQLPVERCIPAGCQALLDLDERTLRAFKAGLQAHVTFRNAARQPVTVPFSLKGFTAAIRSLQ